MFATACSDAALAEQANQQRPPVVLSATAARTHIPNIDEQLRARMDALLRAAYARLPERQQLEAALNKFGTRTEKNKFGAKDIGFNYLGLPRGFQYSEEGARLVLNQPEAAQTLDAAECAEQLQIDRLHKQIVLQILEIADAVGALDTSDGQTKLGQATTALGQCCGATEAAATVDMLVAWSQWYVLDANLFDQQKWQLSTRTNKIDLTRELAFDNDLLVTQSRMKLGGYANHSKPLRIGARVLEGTVDGITLLAPGIGIPLAAQGVSAMFGEMTGGSEENKLLKELYVEKELASRRLTLQSESEIAISSYEQAISTKNSALLLCAESMIAQLVGAVGVNQLLEKQAINHKTFVNHSIQSCAAGTIE